MNTLTASLRAGRGVAFVAVACHCLVAHAQNAPAPTPNVVVPGELVIEPPTLINLGFEWLIQGDDNRNASVAVSFRRSAPQRVRPSDRRFAAALHPSAGRSAP